MCDLLFDLEIRDRLLEEISVNLGLKGWVGCQAAEVFIQGRSSCDNIQGMFRVRNAMNQNKPFPCIEHLLCALAHVHLLTPLIMAEALQGKS